MLNKLDVRFGAIGPLARIVKRSNAGNDSRIAVPPGLDPVDVHGQKVSGLAALDVDRADHRIEPRRVGSHQPLDIGVVHQPMDLRVVAVVLYHAGERILRLDLELFTGFDSQARFIPAVESICCDGAAFDDLHKTGLPLRFVF